MPTMPARTVSVSIDRDPGAVYRYICDPRNLPEWAPVFAKAVRKDQDGWVVETADGLVRIAFASDNTLGVVDHRVSNDSGLDVVNPMRIIANADGAEVLFTLFHPPGVVDDEFRRDLGLVEADLQTLRRVLEGGEQ